MGEGDDAVRYGIIVVVVEVFLGHPCVFEDVVKECNDTKVLVVVSVIVVFRDVFGYSYDVMDVLLFAVVTVLTVVGVNGVNDGFRIWCVVLNRYCHYLLDTHYDI